MSATSGCSPALDIIRSGDLDMLSTLLQPQAGGSGQDMMLGAAESGERGTGGMAQQPSWPLVPQQSGASPSKGARAAAWQADIQLQQLQRQPGSLSSDWGDGGCGSTLGTPYQAAASPFMQAQIVPVRLDAMPGGGGAFAASPEHRPPGSLATHSADMTLFRQPQRQRQSLRAPSADAIVPQLSGQLQAAGDRQAALLPRHVSGRKSPLPQVTAPLTAFDTRARAGHGAGPDQRPSSLEAVTPHTEFESQVHHISESASSGGSAMQLRRRSAPALAKHDPSAAAARIQCEESPVLMSSDDAGEEEQPPQKKRLGRPVKDPRSSRDPNLTNEERRRLMRREANRASARRVRQRKQDACHEIQERIELAMDEQEDIIGRLSAAQQDVDRLQEQLHSTTQAFRSHTEQAARLRLEMASMQTGSTYQYGRGPARRPNEEHASWRSYPVQRVSAPIESGRQPWPCQ